MLFYCFGLVCCSENGKQAHACCSSKIALPSLSPSPLPSLSPTSRIRHVLVPERLRLVHTVHCIGVNLCPVRKTRDGVLKTLPMSLIAEVHFREHIEESRGQPLDSHLRQPGTEYMNTWRTRAASACTPGREELEKMRRSGVGGKEGEGTPLPLFRCLQQSEPKVSYIHTERAIV